jgi:hypothetical protein
MSPARRWMWILWPGFVVAIPAVGIVFTLVDPAQIHLLGAPREVSRLGAYTIGFLFFWCVGSAASALTELLRRPPRKVNRASQPSANAKP